MTPNREKFLRIYENVGMRAAARECGMTPGSAAGLLFRMRHPASSRPKYSRLGATYTTKVYAEIDEEMRCQIDALATRDGISRARVVRELLEWALEEFGDE